MAAARHRLFGSNPMSGLYIMLDKGTKVKAFSSASRGGRSTVKIELDVPDPRELGYLLEQLGEDAARAFQRLVRGLERVPRLGRRHGRRSHRRPPTDPPVVVPG